jgi:hypothetical protein
MERPGYDPLSTVIEVPNWRRIWRLWRAARSVKYRGPGMTRRVVAGRTNPCTT